jgi:hypothetical protein
MAAGPFASRIAGRPWFPYIYLLKPKGDSKKASRRWRDVWRKGAAVGGEAERRWRCVQ